MLLVFTVLTGIAYPLLITGVAQAAFSDQANGSLVTQNGQTVGSSLIGQNYNIVTGGKDTGKPDPKYFQPRPSAGGYDPLASGATNLGPNDPDLVSTINQRRKDIAAFDGVDPASVPPDALTSSGSGLDPDISKAYANEQINRVAKANNLPTTTVQKLVTDNTHNRALGFLGEPYVNVVQLNLALANAT